MNLFKLNSKLTDDKKLKLLKTESIGFHIAMIGLTADYFVKLLMLAPQEYWLGEAILIESLCIYMVIAGLVNGIWSRFFQPGIKYYFLSSFLAGTTVGVFILILSMIHGPVGSIAKDALIGFSGTFTFCFITMMVLGKIYKYRRDKLDTANCLEAENEITEVET